MKTIKGIIAGTLLLMPPTVTAEEPPMVVYPINMPCTSPEKAQEILSTYKELPFASGVASVMSAQDQQYHPGNVKMFLSFDGSFTIAIEMDPGVLCLMATGEEFVPLKPDYDSQIREHMN